jgi:hypothetical protein
MGRDGVAATLDHATVTTLQLAIMVEYATT